MISQSYNLNLIPGGVPTQIHVSQYDSGASRLLVFNLYSSDDGVNTEFTIPPGASITIEGTKPDKKGFSYAVEYSGNVVTVELREQMTPVAGDVVCELKITKGDEILGTANFIISVEPAALELDADMSKTDISGLRELVEQAAESASDAASSAVRAENAASSADQKLSAIGNLSNLITEDKSNLVAAINELANDSSDSQARSDIGDLSNLRTDVKSNLVAAINEVDTHADANTAIIGSTELPTTAKTLTGAIAEHENDIGTIQSFVNGLGAFSIVSGITTSSYALKFDVANYTRALVISDGSNNTVKGAYILYVTGSGTVSYVTILSASQITITTSTNTITFSASGSSRPNIYMLLFHGSATASGVTK